MTRQVVPLNTQRIDVNGQPRGPLEAIARRRTHAQENSEARLGHERAVAEECEVAHFTAEGERTDIQLRTNRGKRDDFLIRRRRGVHEEVAGRDLEESAEGNRQRVGFELEALDGTIRVEIQ